jgi:hypothetical protein
MNYKFLFFYILLVILTFLFIYHYSYTHNKSKNYIELDKSKDLFEDPEYINKFTRLDRKLRKCGENNQKCMETYRNSVIPFSKLEKKMLSWMVKDLESMLGGKFREIFQDIKFIKVKNEIENSMPHTRKGCIVYSERYFISLIQQFQKNPNFLLDDISAVRLIAHEQFHVYQKKYPEKIENFYQKHWKLEKMLEDLPKELKEINRANPDALPDNNWLFKLDNHKFLLPLCVYNSPQSSNINDTSNIYIIVEKNKNKLQYPNLEEQIKNKKLLSSHSQFTNFFGYQGANNYHPHEITASLFEDVIEYTINKKRKNGNSINNSLAYEKFNIYLLNNKID